MKKLLLLVWVQEVQEKGLIQVSCGRLDFLKGTVSREKLLNWGLGEMDWTLTIDRTWVLHFPDQLFNCYNCLAVCRLEVKPVWSLSETVALRWLIWHPVVAVSCLMCAVVALSTLILCCCCSPHPNTVRSATISCYRRNQLTHVCWLQQQDTSRVRSATKGHYTGLLLLSADILVSVCCSQLHASVRDATVSETDQTGFTSRRQTVQIF